MFEHTTTSSATIQSLISLPHCRVAHTVTISCLISSLQRTLQTMGQMWLMATFSGHLGRWDLQELGWTCDIVAEFGRWVVALLPLCSTTAMRFKMLKSQPERRATMGWVLFRLTCMLPCLNFHVFRIVNKTCSNGGITLGSSVLQPFLSCREDFNRMDVVACIYLSLFSFPLKSVH